jgi:hypothetical protein
MRFFFDYKRKNQSLYDYHGDEFQSPQGAIDFAEAIAQDLMHSFTSDWLDWWVEIRNAEGMKFFSLPVNSAEANTA